MSNRLAELRKSKSLTLKELGQQLSMRDNTLSQYETGKRFPKPEIWEQLSSFFHVPVEYLKGDGWSQRDTADFLIYVATYWDDVDLPLPSGITMCKGEISKYGIDKEQLENEWDFPGTFYDGILVNYLITFKPDKIKEYYNSNSDEWLKDDIREDVDSLSEKYLSDSDKKQVIGLAKEKIKNPTVNIVPSLKAAVPTKLWKQVIQLDFDHDPFGNPNIGEFIDSIDRKTLNGLRKAMISSIPLLRDYKFLSGLSRVDIFVGGPAPEYEIAKRLIVDVKKAQYESLKDYFESDPYTATEKIISSFKMDQVDKQSLIQIIEFLVDETGDLKDQIESLETRVHDLEYPNDDTGWSL